MCERLSVLREAMGRVAAGFDARLLSGADASAVAAHAAAIEKMAATVKALAGPRRAVRRLEDGRGPLSRPSPGPHHRHHRGPGGRDPRHRPPARPAARHRAGRLPGELSLHQTAVIAHAAQADPTAEAGLVERAGRLSLAELRNEGAAVARQRCP